jgi:amino acid transporter
MGNGKTPKEPDQNQKISIAERGIALAIALAILATLIVLVLNPRLMDARTFAIVGFLAAVLAGAAGYLFCRKLELRSKNPFFKIPDQSFRGVCIICACFSYVFLRNTARA